MTTTIAKAMPEPDPSLLWKQFAAGIGHSLASKETMSDLGARWVMAADRGRANGSYDLQVRHLKEAILRVTHPSVLARVRGSWDLLAEWSGVIAKVIPLAEAEASARKQLEARKERAALQERRSELANGIVLSLAEAFSGKSEVAQETGTEERRQGQRRRGRPPAR